MRLVAADATPARAGLRVGGIEPAESAVPHATIRPAREPGMERRLVLGIAASFAERYLSTELFEGL